MDQTHLDLLKLQLQSKIIHLMDLTIILKILKLNSKIIQIMDQINLDLQFKIIHLMYLTLMKILKLKIIQPIQDHTILDLLQF